MRFGPVTGTRFSFDAEVLRQQPRHVGVVAVGLVLAVDRPVRREVDQHADRQLALLLASPRRVCAAAGAAAAKAAAEAERPRAWSDGGVAATGVMGWSPGVVAGRRPLQRAAAHGAGAAPCARPSSDSGQHSTK